MIIAIRKQFYVLTGFVFLLLFFSSVSAISYTVQVIALSSESNVNVLKENLIKLGFPAYVISVPTNQGHIFRLRVGSFADRETALKYANAMQGVLDSLPVPQLAEGIPDDLVGLEPKSLGNYDRNNVVFSVKGWNDEYVIRVQQLGNFEEADYYLKDIQFKAFRAVAKDDESLIRVYARPLWPKVYPLDSTNERDAFYSNVVTELLPKLGITVDEIKKYQFLNSDNEPFLVLVEEHNIKSGKTTILKALGDPSSSISQYGPKIKWLDGDDKGEIKEQKTIFELNSPASVNSREVKGNGWSARENGDFTEIEIAKTSKKWLLVAGKPVWAKGNFLLTNYSGQICLYSLK